MSYIHFDLLINIFIAVFELVFSGDRIAAPSCKWSCVLMHCIGHWASLLCPFKLALAFFNLQRACCSLGTLKNMWSYVHPLGHQICALPGLPLRRFFMWAGAMQTTALGSIDVARWCKILRKSERISFIYGVQADMAPKENNEHFFIDSPPADIISRVENTRK